MSTKKIVLLVSGILLLVLIAAALSVMLSFRSLLGPDTDDFGRNHPVPSGDFLTPAQAGTARSDSLFAAGELVLEQGPQPGLYSCRICLDGCEKGKMYLKACEVSTLTPLSEKSLRNKTLTDVDASETPCVLRFPADGVFVIYEGSWGEPYAAGFDLMFVPDGGGEPRCIASAQYVIEGWQR